MHSGLGSRLEWFVQTRVPVSERVRRGLDVPVEELSAAAAVSDV